MKDRDRGTPGARSGSGRVLIWSAAALVLLACAVLVALWPRSEKVAASAKTAPEESEPAQPMLVFSARPSPARPLAPVVTSRPTTAAAGVGPLAVKDFFTADAPESLRKMHDVTASGGLLAMGRMKDVYQLGKDHPGDPRPHLVMAEDAMNRGWEAFAVSHYQRAVKEEPDAREDPRMLKDLIAIAGGKRETAKGAESIVAIYGATATSAVEEALAAAGDKGDTERVQRLAALSASLGSKPK